MSRSRETATGERSLAWGAMRAPLTLHDDEFELFAALVYRETGMRLTEVKKPLIVGRLSSRIAKLGLRSFAQYYRLVRENADEMTEMLDRLTTNETSFFREEKQLEFLADRGFAHFLSAAQEGARPRRVHAWSAACSTGEEPYTLAMLLLAHFPQDWDLSVLASDLSTRALERARAAIYPLDGIRTVPEPLLKRFMLKGVGERAGSARVGPEARGLVSFSHRNLNDPATYPTGPFDLILCRNVLIYFDAASRHAVIDRLLDRLVPDGLLLVGHAESLTGSTARLRAVFPTVYTRPSHPLATAREPGGRTERLAR